MKNIYLVSALLSLILFSSLSYPQLSYANPTLNNEIVTIPLNKWASQRVLSRVVGQIIEKLGTPVDYINISSDNQWGALKRGVIHFQIEVWEPSMGKKFNELVANGHILDLGAHQAKVTEDWWYPSYVENACPELPHWQALKQCRLLFKGRSLLNKGVYFGGSWDYGDADIIRALDLNFSIERLPDEMALWQELTDAVAVKRPIVLLNWSPNWTDIHIEGKFINFPLYSELCENTPEWGLNKKLAKDCGNRRGAWLKKAASPKLKANSPCVYKLIQRISFTNNMIAQASSLIIIEQLSEQKAAKIWSELYAKEIQHWSATTCQ